MSLFPIAMLTIVCIVTYTFELVFGLAGTIIMFAIMTYIYDIKTLVIYSILPQILTSVIGSNIISKTGQAPAAAQRPAQGLAIQGECLIDHVAGYERMAEILEKAPKDGTHNYENRYYLNGKRCHRYPFQGDGFKFMQQALLRCLMVG